jgi:vanillate O-demethylase monooxygenase subunit
VPAPDHLRFAKFTGLVDRYWIYEYLVPGILLMDSGVESSDTMDPGAISLKFRSCQALTPESENSTHYFFMQAHAFALNDESITATLYQSVVSAFHEDKRMIEAQQRLIDSGPADEMVILPFDSALVQFRRVIDGLIADETASRMCL